MRDELNLTGKAASDAVMQTKALLDSSEAEQIEILVQDAAVRDAVINLARTQKCSIELTAGKGKAFRLVLTRSLDDRPPASGKYRAYSPVKDGGKKADTLAARPVAPDEGEDEHTADEETQDPQDPIELSDPTLPPLGKLPKIQNRSPRTTFQPPTPAAPGTPPPTPVAAPAAATPTPTPPPAPAAATPTPTPPPAPAAATVTDAAAVDLLAGAAEALSGAFRGVSAEARTASDRAAACAVEAQGAAREAQASSAAAQAAAQQAGVAVAGVETAAASARKARAEAVEAANAARGLADDIHKLTEELRGQEVATADVRTAWLVQSSTLGHRDGELGARLMRELLAAAVGSDDRPWRVVLVNDAVRMASLDTTAVASLRSLVSTGVEVLCSAGSLDHFGLRAQLQVGDAVGMDVIYETLSGATKVITMQ